MNPRKLINIKKNNKNGLLLGLFFLLGFWAVGQEYFNPNDLKNPKKNGPAVKAKFKEELVYEYKVPKGKHAVFLKNGLRSSNFIAPQLWSNIRDTVYPYRVDIVYSRYPVHDGVYNEIYPLLCNRLIHLFDLDPSLNDVDLSWRTILQTHIDNDEQVNTLFHGVVIWYRTPAEEGALGDNKDSISGAKPLDQTEKLIQGGYQEMVSTIEGMKASSLISDSLKQALIAKPLDVQKQILQAQLSMPAPKESVIPLDQRTPLEMHQYKRQVAEFLKFNPVFDSVVWRTMDRHPEWANALVVNDWTGSMYGYGAQVLHWHLINYKTSGVRYITLFNDGDNKTNASKVIGETGGIYSAEASDIPTIVNLFNLVRLNGSGGDRQENDIEAILESVKRYPNHSEIVLIADNLACIRDIELAVKITKPVRIIVCGYIPKLGINPHLVYLAKVTKGGLYTLSSDIENPRVDVLPTGEIKSNHDNRFDISLLNCTPKPIYEIKYGKESFATYMDYDSAFRDKAKVRKLDLHEKQIEKVPSGIFKMSNMLLLNLSDNKINQLPSGVKKLIDLKELDLSNNEIKALPKAFAKLKYIEILDLSHNQLSDLGNYYPSGYYLKKLNISNNQIGSIIGLNQFKNLQYGNLSNNKIVELPMEISQLKKLISLDLSNNQLLYLPKSIAGLTKLEELNLENNQLGSLPPYLYRLRKLKTLNLAGNPLGEKEKERIRKELPAVEITF
ncbi:MAG: leucine-rich repeat domain-containing protein [bacterium]|nr:leucine-rich repeat domain-containing protein [bacterium]